MYLLVLKVPSQIYKIGKEKILFNTCYIKFQTSHCIYFVRLIINLFHIFPVVCVSLTIESILTDLQNRKRKDRPQHLPYQISDVSLLMHISASVDVEPFELLYDIVHNICFV